MANNAIYKEFKQEAAKIAADIIAWRRHLHANPELSYKEVNTTAFVADTLRSFGYADVSTGFGPVETGARADLGQGGPLVALRGDLDALPLTETADVPCRSTVAGVMHACGHDAHTAVLLGAAKLLKAKEAQLPGRVRLIFQPGEETRVTHFEKPLSGASYVIRSGAMEGVEAVFGMHVWGPFEAGKLFVKEGAAMMASGRFTLKIIGQGTHGASPHLGHDPIVAACNVVSALQTVVSREVSPTQPALITVGTIHGGTATNIIPEEVELSGTIRAASLETVEFIGARIGEMAQKTAEAHRCTTAYNLLINGDAVRNDAAMTALVREAGERVLGAEHVCDMEMITGSEDFREYASRFPSALFFMGMADEKKGIGQSHHDPSFRVNDDALADAAAVMASVAWRYLESRK